MFVPSVVAPSSRLGPAAPYQGKNLSQLFGSKPVVIRGANEPFSSPFGSEQRIFGLVSGWAYSYRMFTDGRRQVLGIHLSGEILGLSPQVDESYLGHHSLTSVTLVSAGYAELMSNANSHPDGAFGLTAEVIRNEILLRERLADVSRRPAHQRIANLLLELYCRSCARLEVASPQAIELSIPLRQEVIADAVGLSAIYVNRTLQDFKRKGIIRYIGHDLRITDSQALRAASTLSDSYIEWLKRPVVAFRPSIAARQ